MNLHANAQDRRFRERLVRRAIETRASLLAPALHAYALAEGMDWRGLADHLGCTEDALNRIACCRPPRPGQFAADVEALAEGLVDFDRLLNLLRRLQILTAFADHAAETSANYDSAPTGGMLLAARDREEMEGGTGRQGDRETAEEEEEGKTDKETRRQGGKESEEEEPLNAQRSMLNAQRSTPNTQRSTLAPSPNEENS